MKYRPSKRFLWGMVALCPLTAALWLGVVPELGSFSNRPVPGEMNFAGERPDWEKPRATAAKGGSGTLGLSVEWLEKRYEDVMTWKLNPWKTQRNIFGNHYLRMAGSKDPAEAARAAEIKRQAEAWFLRLLKTRYPEMAVAMRNVPDDRNGFLKWLEFQEGYPRDRWQKKQVAFPAEVAAFLKDEGAWNSAAAREWLAGQQDLLGRIREIGQMEERSVNGIDVERWYHTPASLAKSCAEALLLSAMLAAEDGDVNTALAEIRTARGISEHLSQVETPTLQGMTIQIVIQRSLEDFTLRHILPALPEGRMDPVAWEQALQPRVPLPSDFARAMTGEWNIGMRYYLLPMLTNTDDPKFPVDGGDLLDTYTAPFTVVQRTYRNAALSDLPTLPKPQQQDFSHLSRNSREVGEMLAIGAGGWRDSWDRNASDMAITQAAFAILKGQPVPKDPVYGLPYRWDEATRTLSVPDSPAFEAMKIKPVVVPVRRTGSATP